MAAGFGPDVVILDLGLPKWTDTSSARACASGSQSVRLIALTGYADVDRGGTTAAGFPDYLAKPASAIKLL